MPQPLKHKKSRQRLREEGAMPGPTAKERVRFRREAKSHGMASNEYRAYWEPQDAAAFAQARHSTDVGVMRSAATYLMSSLF